LSRLATMVESGDARPAELLKSNIGKACEDLPKRLADWENLNKAEIANVNAMLAKSGLPTLPVKSEVPRAPDCK